MFETFGFENLTPRAASVWFALGLGILFGMFAERSGFCLRRALVGDDRLKASGVWLTALAFAVISTQAAAIFGLIDFSEHRFHATDLPLLAIALGGLTFGAGMVLTRGCASRLTVLGATGNLRALSVLLVFAIVAHATLKGVLAPLRTTLSAITFPVGEITSLAALPGGAILWSTLIALACLSVAWVSGNRVVTLLGGAGLGVLVAVGWVGTSFLLYDEFDPITFETLSFTAPASEALFFTIASTAIPAGFGPGLLGGVLIGALGTSLIAGRFQWQSFDSPRQTGRYMAGATLMGMGGALAGGCSVGAGLSGVSTLSVAALITLAFIVLGALAAHAALTRSRDEAVGPSTRPALQPAE